MSQELILNSSDGGIARLVLNRPAKRNSLNSGLISALKESLLEADADAEVFAVVISGAGKDFCAGADLSALQTIAEASVEENQADARNLLDLFLTIRRLKKPVIAAVRGRALAGGCGLATACDIVLASSSARFGYPEVKIGFVPAMVISILRRNVSEKCAFELVTRGEEIDAPTAEKYGLVNRVFPDENFDSDVAAYVQLYTQTSHSAVTLTKQLLYQVDGLAFEEAIECGLDVNVIARLTSDCQKGIARFLRRE